LSEKARENVSKGVKRALAEGKMKRVLTPEQRKLSSEKLKGKNEEQ